MSSPNAQTRRNSKSPSPKRHIEKAVESTVEKDENLEDVKSGDSVTAEKKEESTDEKSVENSPSEMDTDSKVKVEKALKRPREEDTGLYPLKTYSTLYIHRPFKRLSKAS